jgi:hypothetical protein
MIEASDAYDINHRPAREGAPASSACGSTLLAGLSPTAENTGTTSRLIAEIFSFWLAWPWLKRQPSSLVCLRRAFGQGAIVPHPEWQNGNDSPVLDVLYDDETAVVRFAVDQAEAPLGRELPKWHASSSVHHCSNRCCRQSGPFAHPFFCVRCDPRPSRANPSLGEMNLCLLRVAGAPAQVYSVFGLIATRLWAVLASRRSDALRHGPPGPLHRSH